MDFLGNSLGQSGRGSKEQKQLLPEKSNHETQVK